MARRDAAAQSVWDADEDEPVLDTTVGGILRAAAGASPDVTALVAGTPDAGSRRRWTYAELLAESEAAAAALAARFEASERVAVVAPSLPESLVLTYAAALAGVVLVPVNPALRAPELAYVLGQSGASGVFLVGEHRGHDLAATVARLRPELPGLREVVFFDEWESFLSSAPGPGATAARAVAPDDIAQLVYTSGTTGSPKGALLTHRGMTNAARVGAVRFGMRPRDVYVQTMPLFHVGGQVVSFQLCQLSATAVLVPAFDPGLVLELIESERATLTCGVPTMLLALVEHPDFPRRDLSSLRAVSGGGAVVPAALVRHIEDSLGVQITRWSSGRPRRRGSSPRPISTTTPRTRRPPWAGRCRASGHASSTPTAARRWAAARWASCRSRAPTSWPATTISPRTARRPPGPAAGCAPGTW